MKRFKKTPPKSEFRDAVLLNDASYFDYLDRMRKIALSMFEWENLPDSMNARYLELTLFYKGQAGLLYDENFGFINTQATDGGYINIYGLPTRIQCYSYRYNEMRDLYVPSANRPKEEEAILVLNNYDRTPTANTLQLFAYRLAEAQRTADVNIKAQRTPILLTTDQRQEFSMKKLYEQYDGNTPVIYADKNSGLNPDAIRAIRTDAPFIANDILQYKIAIWNEFLSFLGISNLDEKRERLISNEVDSNNELVNMNLQSYLIPRKKACEEFNQKYGMNIDVKVRSDLYNVIKQYESITSVYNEAKSEDEKLKGEDNG